MSFEKGYCLHTFLADIEKQQIAKALIEANDNKTNAAKLLGIQRTTLLQKMRRYGFALKDFMRGTQ